MHPKKIISQKPQTQEQKTKQETKIQKTRQITKIKCKPVQKTLTGQILLEPQAKSKSKKFDTNSKDIIVTSSSRRWSKGDGKTPSKLTISAWNVNGIRSVLKKQELQNYCVKYDPDIICINETKIDDKVFSSNPISLKGYQGYWNFCKTSAGYSGVAIFSKFKPISITQDLPQPQHSQQGRLLNLQFEKFYLITVYLPNSGQKLQRLDYRTKEYDRDFQNHLQQLKKKKPVILCGDLNVCHKQIDLAEPKGNERRSGFTIQERNNFTQFLAKGWIDTFRHFYEKEVKYSWWNVMIGGRENNIGWRLDYFIVNKQFIKNVKDSRINNEVYGSDHCPIQLDIFLQDE